MLILFLKPNATFKYFLPFGLIVLFGATLIDPNSSPCGVSGIDNGNTGHFYVTFVECVSWYARHVISVNPSNNSWISVHFSL